MGTEPEPPERPWQPLLVGDAAARAWVAIDEVSAALAALPREALRDPTLAGGTAGMALYFAYLAGVQEDRGHEDTAARLLEWSQEDVAAGLVPAGPGLYQGFTGVAWVAEHITGEPQDAIDEHLAAYLARTPWLGDYDLISGLAGIGVWALAALPRPGAAECLRLVCTRLCELARPARVGLTWWTPPELLPPYQREQFPRGHENLGLAHGMPAAVALLAQACASGVLGDELGARALATTRGGMARLLSLAQPDAPSRYASMIDEENEPPGAPAREQRSRLAWCYGDAGVAVAIATAAKALGEPAWRAEAEATALAAARRDAASAGVMDAGICHGAAGLGLLFARLHHELGHAELAEAARRWFVAALDLREPGKYFAGFHAHTPDGPEANPDWLSGATGIAHALLAAVTDTEPVWDRLLLASAM